MDTTYHALERIATHGQWADTWHAFGSATQRDAWIKRGNDDRSSEFYSVRGVVEDVERRRLWQRFFRGH